jgi:hypothetical protein
MQVGIWLLSCQQKSFTSSDGFVVLSSGTRIVAKGLIVHDYYYGNKADMEDLIARRVRGYKQQEKLVKYMDDFAFYFC